MAAQKPSIPKGTRDFGVTEMIRRNYIFDTIRKVFQLYGFKPIETPAMENLSTLLGKYGDEGDRLIYEVTNSHIQVFIDELTNYELISQIIETEGYKGIIKGIQDSIDKGLRYDLTVPFARFVVMHQNEITFPFKRYQIQPVWRADRPQKGRYREFYQCDVDVIGSDSLLNELELIQITDAIFNELKIKVTIKLNNRKILTGISEVIGEVEKIVDITVAIDKLDKIGASGVYKELEQKGVSKTSIQKLVPIINLPGNSKQKLEGLKEILKESSVGMQGIKEIEFLFDDLKLVEVKSNVEFDLTLARGLNYYTGAIFEVKANDVAMGSIAGGGRYDDLTGIFGLPNVSGVGISFGADRIYDVLNELNLFPEGTSSSTKILFVNLGVIGKNYCLPLLEQVRKNGISAEIYPYYAKMKKQLDYANANNIPFVIIAWEDEISSDTVSIKNMQSGQQQKILKADLISHLRSLL